MANAIFLILLRRLDALVLAAGAAREHRLEELPGIARRVARDIFRRAGRNDLAAAVAAFGAEIDDPIGGLDHFEIVLDDNHGVAGLDQLVQHIKKLRHVVKMQARGGLVENVERAAGCAFRQLLGELDALRLAARKRGRLLPDMDVIEADAVQEL